MKVRQLQVWVHYSVKNLIKTIKGGINELPLIFILKTHKTEHRL